MYPVLEVLARCDEVRLAGLKWEAGASVEDVLEVARRYGLPRHLDREGNARVRLWEAGPLQRRSQPGLSAAPRLLSPPLALGDVVERALAHMAAEADPARATSLLLRGAAVRQLLARPTHLRMRLEELSGELEDRLGPGAVDQWGRQERRVSSYQALPGATRRYVLSYQALSCAGALVLCCSDAAARVAAAEAAQRLLGGCGAGGEAGGVGEGLSDAVEAKAMSGSGLWYRSGDVAKVLQALWDGAEEGGPGPATGSREGELARLRWLLETWEGLEGLPGPVELTSRG
ncbi:hypothetical protein HYH03_010095 [Edaphochlamys debaryana]|uniref:Uncharacterized protein n=1 Tax=Edaphochlamys debaryana TaxID=47281 RepID=A0A835XXA8_9CHLO|nr:hypothetical protein HYH03_010095 [Edaphochlamys debaryana]|eukprot:KAG2491519.1 hypothetical protein HYH03_010095 [Edaphochlamys debaryana]